MRSLEMPAETSSSNILDVRELCVHYPVRLPLLQQVFARQRPVVHAVDGVSFSLRPGEIFGIVGESGSGKTTLGRAIVRLVEPTEGKIFLEGKDVTRLPESDIRPLRSRVQMVFQDPHASLPPTMSLGRAIGHPLLIHGISGDEKSAKPAVLSVMREVGLTPEEQLYEKFPADLSGGQKQRAVLARAMILRPALLVADEPVAMLDMSIRARVLELMLQLQRTHNLTILYITHDLATAKLICNRIGIMYLGRLVEIGDARDIYIEPRHPYTQALLRAIPVPDPSKRERRNLPRGEVPDAVNLPAGCRYHPRCQSVLSTCGWEGRDFTTYLEQRRLRVEKSREEEEKLGKISLWEARGTVASRKVLVENSEVLLANIRAVLAEAPSQMRDAVVDVGIKEKSVFVRFEDPEPVPPREADGRTVECLLYPLEAEKAPTS